MEFIFTKDRKETALEEDIDKLLMESDAESDKNSTTCECSVNTAEPPKGYIEDLELVRRETELIKECYGNIREILENDPWILENTEFNKYFGRKNDDIQHIKTIFNLGIISSVIVSFYVSVGMNFIFKRFY